MSTTLTPYPKPQDAMEGAAVPIAASDAPDAAPASSASPPTIATSSTSTNDTPGPTPLYAPKPNRCSFFLKRKTRYCTVPRLPNSIWCGNHQHLAAGYDDDGAIPARSKTQEKRGGQRRLPCPLDPKHTVYERELKAHLRVCNVKKETQGLEDQPYYRLGVNSGTSGGTPSTSAAAAAAIPTLTMEEVRALFAKAQLLASEKRPHPRGDTIEQIRTGPVATKILASIESNNVTSEAKARHVIQQASLVSHLDRCGLLHNHSTCVEMGAGRGTLGQAIHLAFPQARVVLVERSGVKFKADAPFRRTGEGSYFERYRLDIRDLWLKGLPLSSQVVMEPSSSSSSSSPSFSSSSPSVQSPPLVFMGKHVCGVATDLSLRAIAKFLQATTAAAEEGATTALTAETENGTSDKKGGDAAAAAVVKVGVVIATCCYHVCAYDDYVGMETWENELGLTRAEFVVAQRSACWVSSLTSSRGHRHKSRARKAAAAGAAAGGAAAAVGEGKKEEEEVEEQEEVQAGGEGEGGEEGGEDEGEDDFISHGKGLSREEKIKVGWACKRLIDYGRLQYLRKCGLEAECVVYCDPDVSPENSCILAWSKEGGVE